MIPPFLTCHVFLTSLRSPPYGRLGIQGSGLWLRFPVMVGHIMFPCLPRTMEEFLWDSIRILRFHRVSKIRVTRVISSFISLRGSFEGLWRHILVSQFSERSQLKLIYWLSEEDRLSLYFEPRLFFRLRFSSFHSRGQKRPSFSYSGVCIN